MNNRRLPFIILGVIAFIVVMALSSSLFYTISATERAVMFYPFGKGLDKDNIIGPGTHLKAPWNDAFVYAVSENSKDENMDVLDKNGLSIHVDVTVRYSPMTDKIGFIHEKFYKGTTVDYVDVLVIPEVRSTVRQVMGRFTAEEIYSTKRAEVESSIRNEAEKILLLSFVNAPALLIRSIVFQSKLNRPSRTNYSKNRKLSPTNSDWIKKKVRPSEKELQPRVNRGQILSSTTA